MDNNETTYILPEGWIWTTIDEIGVVSSGGTPDRGNYNYFKGNIPWVKSGELNQGVIYSTEEKISEDGLINSSAKMLPPKALLIALYGGTVGKLAILGIPAATNQAVASIVSPVIDTRFLLYFFTRNRDKLLSKRKGGAQPNISQKVIKEFPLPLPPLEEQNRIVARIEELFSELDHAEETLKKVQKQLEVYKQALLKSAFEGKLTEKWREENEIPTNRERHDLNLHTAWNWTSLGNVGKLISGQHILESDYNKIGNGIPYLTGPSDFGDRYPRITRWTNNPKVITESDDILITVKGSGVGKLNIANDRYAIGRQIMAYRFDAGPMLYIYYFFEAISIKLNNLGSGSAIPGISRDSILNIGCPVPSKNEQYQIIQELESRFTLIENLEMSVSEGLQKTEVFRQKIIKNAFEGKLVPQFSHEESTNELLKRIQIEKEIYLIGKKAVESSKSKKVKMIETEKSILEILKESKDPIQAKDLWLQSKHKENIEDFYSELKEIYNQIKEVKKETESFISLKI